LDFRCAKALRRHKIYVHAYVEANLSPAVVGVRPCLRKKRCWRWERRKEVKASRNKGYSVGKTTLRNGTEKVHLGWKEEETKAWAGRREVGKARRLHVDHPPA
jgi:hypothetical protein